MQKLLKTTLYLCLLLVGIVLPAGAKSTDVTRHVDMHLVLQWIQEDERDAAEAEEMLPFLQQKCDQTLAEYAHKCNDYRVRLYSCQEDRLFETTMYLDLVDKLYHELDQQAQPHSEYIDVANRDLRRYQLLVQTLRNMPPALEEPAEEEVILTADSVELQETDTLLHQLLEQAGGETSFYMLTEEEQQLRDSCLVYADKYIVFLQAMRDLLVGKSESFAQLRDEFASTLEFADDRSVSIDKSIVSGGQYTLAYALQYPLQLLMDALVEFTDKFSSMNQEFSMKEFWVILGELLGALVVSILIVGLLWVCTKKKEKVLPRMKKNPAIFTNIIYMLLLCICLFVDIAVYQLPLITLNEKTFLVYFVYVLLLQVSLLIREQGHRASLAMHLYVPPIFFGFVLTFLHMFFMPDVVLCVIIGPLALICLIWESILMGRYWNKVAGVDSGVSAATTVVFLLMTIEAACGYTFLSMETFFWWQAQQAALLIVVALALLLRRLQPQLASQKRAYLEKATGKKVEKMPKYVIQVTWFYDLIRIVGIPLLGILSVPFCINSAMEFYNGGEEFVTFFHQTLFSIGAEGDVSFKLSAYNITLALSLFFVFRYLKHLVTAIYLQTRIRSVQKRQGQHEIETNQVNFALGTKVVGIIVWGLYICVVCMLFELPLQSLTVVFAGMAAGLSFAMQDIISNFFYGMQLMAGRLRVGDYVICDEYRGEVTSITYQATEIHTVSGSDVSFTNKDLFAKNFVNLTKQDPYERNCVTCDVAYGSDLQKVEDIAMEVIKSMNEKDKFGRWVIRMQDVRVDVDNLAASGITIAVRFAVLVDRIVPFMAKLRRNLYEALVQGNVEIPFDQLDIHIKDTCEQKEQK